MRLNWNRPSADGGSAIIRYEYRYAATGRGVERVGEGGGGITWGDGREPGQRPGVYL